MSPKNTSEKVTLIIYRDPNCISLCADYYWNRADAEEFVKTRAPKDIVLIIEGSILSIQTYLIEKETPMQTPSGAVKLK